MIKSCEILLPPGVFAVVDKFICQAKVPDKSQISRFRLTMDTAMMLLERRRHWREYKQGEQHVRYLMWDSSPQFGRDYELALVHSLAFCHLAAAWKLACCIQGTADKQTEELLNSEEDDSDLLDKHAKDMARLHGMLGVHSLPCVLIGFGASSFAHKFGALLHSMRLEHFDNEPLACDAATHHSSRKDGKSGEESQTQLYRSSSIHQEYCRDLRASLRSARCSV